MDLNIKKRGTFEKFNGIAMYLMKYSMAGHGQTVSMFEDFPPILLDLRNSLCVHGNRQNNM